MSAIKQTCSVQNVVTNDAFFIKISTVNVHDSPSFWVVVAAHDEETLEELIEVINDHEDISSVLL
jgi:transcriptional/translational regulatory protein YebC/TACO1